MNRRSFLGRAAATLGALVSSKHSTTPTPDTFQYNDHIREFTDYREMILAVGAHARATGQKVLPVDDPTRRPVRIGFATIPKDPGEPMCLWRISLPNFATSVKKWQDRDPRIAQSFIRAHQTAAGKQGLAQILSTT